jgi:hypothetical protein
VGPWCCKEQVEQLEAERAHDLLRRAASKAVEQDPIGASGDVQTEFVGVRSIVVGRAACVPVSFPVSALLARCEEAHEVEVHQGAAPNL